MDKNFIEQLKHLEQISDVLTDQDLKKGYEIAERIDQQYPEGFKILSHLKKIPLIDHPGEYGYEYEFSDAFKLFMLELNRVYPPDIASAVGARIIMESMDKS